MLPLEAIRLDQNKLEGEVPASWFAAPPAADTSDSSATSSVVDTAAAGVAAVVGPASTQGSALSRSLRVLTLWNNKLTGQLPQTQPGAMQVRECACVWIVGLLCRCL